MANGTLLSPIMCVCCLLLFIISAVDNILLPSVANVSYILSFVANDSLLFTISGHSLCAISGYFLSLVIGDNPLSAVFDCFLSFIANSSPLFAVFDDSSLFFLLFASSQALFMLYILSRTCYSFLPFLPLVHSFFRSLLTPLSCNLNLYIEKRLFDQVFII